MMTDDMELVREFATRQSESAFAALVSRHAGLVYSAALRRVNQPQQAEEITQAVFIILARKAASLDEKTILSGWLYRTAGFVSGSAIKQELRRQQREQEAYMQSTLNETQTDEAWQSLAPLLEEAMLRLGQTDRDALLLRFFEGRSLNEVGTALGATEQTAKKRVNRALEKLRKFFSGRGVVLSAGTIATCVSANSVQAAPAALTKTITVVALAKGATATTSTLALVNSVLKVGVTTKALSVITTKILSALGLGTTVLGPAVGLASGVLAAKVSLESTVSPRHRTAVVRYTRRLWLFLALYFSGLIALCCLPSRALGQAHPVLLCLGIIGFHVAIALRVLFLGLGGGRELMRIGQEEAALTGKKIPGTYEYQSRYNFLGLPLIHICFNCLENGKLRPAKGWIALGSIAYGGIFACGLACSVAPISVGGVAAGLISLGGVTLGGISFGALTFGWWAVGVAVVGYYAVGVSALAWMAASGAVAVAHHYALGDAVFAQHADDAIARAFCRQNYFFQHIMLFPMVFATYGLIIAVAQGIQLWRLRRKKSLAAAKISST